MKNISLHSSTEIIRKISRLCEDSYAVMSACDIMTRHYRERHPEPTAYCVDWYRGLEVGTPDYSIYSSVRYVPEAVACYLVYSKGYIRAISGIKLPSFDKIYDLGCGVGLTTALLSECFPAAKVIGTQVAGKQKDVAEKLMMEYRFNLSESTGDCRNAMIVALDYAEHFYDPINHFQKIINQRPPVIVMANSFSAKSVGHFNSYSMDGVEVEPKKAGRVFNSWMRGNGYRKLPTGFYNDRPYVWVRHES
jgi:hypothetical protein